MGNSNSRYEHNMLANMPPGYIPTYPAVPPYALKKKGWNPFGKSRKRREEELKQYFYTTPFVWMYPPGSSCTYISASKAQCMRVSSRTLRQARPPSMSRAYLDFSFWPEFPWVLDRLLEAGYTMLALLCHLNNRC